jgi:3-mercaptopyruvate sulfurtransferase SseA
MPDFFNNTAPETLLIAYCSDPRCHLAERLAVRLHALGYANVRFMPAGWSAWQANGYPVESDPAFTSGQSLDQATGCSSGECSDVLASPAEAAQRD